MNPVAHTHQSAGPRIFPTTGLLRLGWEGPQAFNKSVGTLGSVGIWRETYTVGYSGWIDPTRQRRVAVLACIAARVWPYWASAVDAANISGTWPTDDGAQKVAVVIVKAADGSRRLSDKVAWVKDPTRDGKPYPAEF